MTRTRLMFAYSTTIAVYHRIALSNSTEQSVYRQDDSHSAGQ